MKEKLVYNWKHKRGAINYKKKTIQQNLEHEYCGKCVDRCCLSWGSGRGLLEVYQGWTDAALAG